MAQWSLSLNLSPDLLTRSTSRPLSSSFPAVIRTFPICCECSSFNYLNLWTIFGAGWANRRIDPLWSSTLCTPSASSKLYTLQHRVHTEYTQSGNSRFLASWWKNSGKISPEAEFLDVIGTQVFLLAITSEFYLYSPSPLEQKWSETGL
jgi:hypothetical protein